MSAPRIALERMMHRQSIAVPGETLASYALLKLVPAGETPEPLPLTLGLCIDISGSMYWSDGTGKPRIERVREAATAAIAKLKPTDRIAIVVFGNGSELVLPPTAASEVEKIADTLQKLDSFSVDQAGTAMDQGIEKAFLSVTGPDERGRLQQVVVLTDGETTGESRCKELAMQAWQQKVRFTIMGVGTEWNSALIKDLAQRSDGRWYYIDAENPDDAMRIFLSEFDRLSDTAFANVKLEVKAVKDVKIKRLRQVTPIIKEVPLIATDDRFFTAELGTLERSQPPKFILDLSLPKRPDGKYAIAQIEVKYSTPAGSNESTGSVPLEIAYTAAGNGYVNAEVARHIDEIQIFELNSNLQQAISSDHRDEIKRTALQIARKGTVLGPRGSKKTQLAQQILDELEEGGKVSRKTMLAVDDVVRTSDS